MIVELNCYSASSLKQQSANRHIAPLGHIILIPSQPVFALSPKCCVLSGKATITNFINSRSDLLNGQIVTGHLYSKSNQITLLSLNIYKHVCDKYKQTNNYVYEKEQT